jgi:prepilin-type N-terminal cleavage/methylation domain-containing protein
MLRNTQSGFTLIELMVVMVVIGIVAAITVGVSNTDSSRGRGLYNHMVSNGESLLRLKNDVGCNINEFRPLFDRAEATAENSFCGIDIATRWQGPYSKPLPVNADGNLQAEKFAAGIVISVIQDGNRFLLEAAGVPTAIARRALAECNSADVEADPPTDFAGNARCVSPNFNAENGTNNVRYAFDFN